MRREKRIEIDLMTERSLIIRSGRHSIQTTCQGCGREVRMITPDQAAMLADVRTRTIFQWVEVGKVHFVETPDGKVLICANSLL
jgi:predicted site-specific integrase-resolvase